MNGTTGEFPASAVPASGTDLDDEALSGAGAFRHAAAVVGDDSGLLEVVVPYLDDGLTAGDLTVLSCSPATADLVRRELGAAVRGLEVDGGLILHGTRAPDIFTHFRQYASRAMQGGTSRLRTFCEVPGADEPRQIREEQRIEAAANHVMAELQVTTLCVYDERRLPDELVASARATHPQLVTRTSWTVNPAYQEPQAYLRGLPTPRRPLDDVPPMVVVDDAASLPELRHALTGALPGLVDDEEQLEDLRLGISEVAANAFRHGRRPVSGRLWSDGRQLVCEITDSGTSFDDPLAGFIPAHGFDLGRGGMGLWLARKLFDHVDLLRRPTGLTVRLSTALR